MDEFKMDEITAQALHDIADKKNAEASYKKLKETVLLAAREAAENGKFEVKFSIARLNGIEDESPKTLLEKALSIRSMINDLAESGFKVSLEVDDGASIFDASHNFIVMSW